MPITETLNSLLKSSHLEQHGVIFQELRRTGTGSREDVSSPNMTDMGIVLTKEERLGKVKVLPTVTG